ncbi:hypothetical protein GLYMA_02G207200v4 [Glycine max]|uniref:Uncharacterized protein n=1 Tax=Glycine max TaxID=3847 RepID=K7K9T2_SOYBN|nr:hypothetical protein GYH30_004706 [Glycine max]KRH72354.1 hypothetical protein GLYMA_02G207200v4 [Glycine max]
MFRSLFLSYARVLLGIGFTLTELKDDIEKLVSKLEDKVCAPEEGSCMDAIILHLHGCLPPELQIKHGFDPTKGPRSEFYFDAKGFS